MLQGVPGYWVPAILVQDNMRNTILGAAAAAALILVLFVVSRLVPAPTPAGPARPQANVPTPAQIAAQAARITPGFTGTVVVGQWEVRCDAKTAEASAQNSTVLNASGAPTTDGSKPANGAKPAEGQQVLKLGRCRSALIVRPRNNPQTFAVIAVFRLMEDSDNVALILHTQPVEKVGSKVLVGIADKQVIPITVTNCEKEQCIALGILVPKVYSVLATKQRLAIVVPIQATGKRMIIPLSLIGLPESVTAMRNAG
jgi:invasion protein IalB